MAKLKLTGLRDERRLAEREAEVDEDLFKVEVREVVRVGALRGVGDEITVDAKDDDVVELELDGGVRLWTSVAQLREDLPQLTSRGGPGDEDVLLLPPELTLGTPTRGFGDFVLRTFQLFRVEDKVAKLSARQLAEKVESKLRPGPGLYDFQDLYRFQAVYNAGEKPPAEPQKKTPLEPSDKPYLIFIHGTSSNTSGAFGDLPSLHPTLWQKLVEVYEDRLLAFEHRTWSQSPIENAHDLLELLPDNARLHLVSHSRGGLVGELLCRGRTADDSGPRPPFDPLEHAFFDPDNPENDAEDDAFREGLFGQAEAIGALDGLLRRKQPRVERFVRVACPARGTTLVSGRLDRLLSILLYLMELALGQTANPLYQSAKALVLAFAKQRTRPDVLPGLAAQMPTAPLIAILNRAEVEVDASLLVVAGDIEGAGVLGKLKVLATDLFYARDHDLVVDTQAMYGGTQRSGGARRLFVKGPTVDHFRYFRNEDTAVAVREGLLSPSPETLYEKLELETDEPLTRSWLRDMLLSRGDETGRDLPVVFLLPGIMGSTLSADGNRIWLDLSDIAKGRLGQLKHTDAASADGLIKDAYADLALFLSHSHEVIPFPYDWRSSLRQAAKELGGAIKVKLGETAQPIRILAHSMGGLVARAMMIECPDVWRDLCARDGSRLIMLGTPNQGSHVISRVLVAQERMLKLLARVDLTRNRVEVLEIVSRYRGLLELLPVKSGNELDLFDYESWKKLEEIDDCPWVKPYKVDLDEVVKLRKAFDEQKLDGERVLYVAGSAPATPQVLLPDEQDRRIRFLATNRGDGRVLWSTGIPPGVPTWYMNAVHGKLAAHRPAFSALLDLLAHGQTQRLPQTPQEVLTRGAPSEFLLPDDEVIVFPNQQDLETEVLGFQAEVEKAAPQVVQVHVVHGNLAFARHPVMVGHYINDAIVSAEEALDRRLDELLSQRHRLGRYPGPLRSAEVIFAPPGHKPAGAIVVGLDKVGELTAGRLRETLTHGLLEYAAKYAEHQRFETERSPSLSLSTLLVGSGEGGVTVIEALRSLLQAVQDANTLLKNEKGQLRIDHLEIVELYEDLAIEALHALGQLTKDPTLVDDGKLIFELTDTFLQILPGGRRRLYRWEDDSWWHRLKIVRGEKDGKKELWFDSLSRRARAERKKLPINDRALEPLLAEASSNQKSSSAVCETLFELLLPNDFKEGAPNERNLVLILDEHTAAYPWELMIDPLQSSTRMEIEAQAVKAGLIRQLSEEIYRARPRYADIDVAALVIGDTQAPKPWPKLEGAVKEADAVDRLLRQAGFKPEKRIRPKGTELLKMIVPGNFRILHLAGHGIYDQVQADSGGEKVTGMVLGDGIYLDAALVEQIRRVPELVFLNCCFLGKIEAEDRREPATGSRAALAANLATQFIRMGAKAVVAAGWAVADDAALAFAETFYGCMLEGHPFGEAVLQARQRAAQFPTTNTWGAYQCYGDPHYELRPLVAAPSGDRSEEPLWFVTPIEMEIELENLKGSAETSTVSKVNDLREQLKRYERLMPPKWRDHSSLNLALGRGFAEVGMFASAIRAYRRALAAENAGSTLTDIEQLANLECRLAVMRAFGQPTPDQDRDVLEDSAQELIDSGFERLEQLEAIRGIETIEHRALQGAAYKRRAVLSDKPADRAENLRAMCDAYRRAHELHRQRNNELYPYPLHSWLIGRLLLGDPEDKLEDLNSWLTATGHLAEDSDTKDPSFWNGIIAAENLLVKQLARFAAEHKQVSTLYLRAYHRGASPRQIQSVCEHLFFIETLIEADLGVKRDKGETKRRQAMREMVRQILDAFQKESGMDQF